MRAVASRRAAGRPQTPTPEAAAFLEGRTPAEAVTQLVDRFNTEFMFEIALFSRTVAPAAVLLFEALSSFVEQEIALIRTGQLSPNAFLLSELLHILHLAARGDILFRIMLEGNELFLHQCCAVLVAMLESPNVSEQLFLKEAASVVGMLGHLDTSGISIDLDFLEPVLNRLRFDADCRETVRDMNSLLRGFFASSLATPTAKVSVFHHLLFDLENGGFRGLAEANIQLAFGCFAQLAHWLSGALREVDFMIQCSKFLPFGSDLGQIEDALRRLFDLSVDKNEMGLAKEISRIFANDQSEVVRPLFSKLMLHLRSFGTVVFGRRHAYAWYSDEQVALLSQFVEDVGLSHLVGKQTEDLGLVRDICRRLRKGDLRERFLDFLTEAGLVDGMDELDDVRAQGSEQSENE